MSHKPRLLKKCVWIPKRRQGQHHWFRVLRLIRPVDERFSITGMNTQPSFERFQVLLLRLKGFSFFHIRKYCFKESRHTHTLALTQAHLSLYHYIVGAALPLHNCRSAELIINESFLFPSFSFSPSLSLSLSLILHRSSELVESSRKKVQT